MVKRRAEPGVPPSLAPYYKMDHYGWLADELTELWEQLEAPELKGDAAEVQKLLQYAIEAANFAARARRKAAAIIPIEMSAMRAPGAPGARRRPHLAGRRKRNRPEVAPGPVPFAIGFA